MSKWIGKKQVLLTVLVVALGVAVYLNYYFSSVDPLASQTGTESTGSTTGGKNLGDSLYVGATTSDVTDATQTTDYFASARQNRQNARTEALEILQDSLQDVKISEEMQQQVLERMETLAREIERESAIESLITAKGFADCVVYIDGENCQIVVSADSLDEAQTLQILDIVTSQSSVSAEKTNIVAVNS